LRLEGLIETLLLPRIDFYPVSGSEREKDERDEEDGMKA
jgi:hypothetical protein